MSESSKQSEEEQRQAQAMQNLIDRCRRFVFFTDMATANLNTQTRDEQHAALINHIYELHAALAVVSTRKEPIGHG